MATYKDVIDAVKVKVGDPSSGFDRALALKNIIHVLTFDLPNRLGGPFSSGFVKGANLGGSTAPADGKYSLPSKLRTPGNLIQLDTQFLLFGRDIFTDAVAWWSVVSLPTRATGRPTKAFLIDAQTIMFEPVPQASDDFVVEYWGTVYPDFDSIGESTTVVRDDYVPVLEAGVAVIMAADAGKLEIAEAQGVLWEARLKGLETVSAEWPRGAPAVRDF